MESSSEVMCTFMWTESGGGGGGGGVCIECSHYIRNIPSMDDVLDNCSVLVNRTL